MEKNPKSNLKQKKNREGIFEEILGGVPEKAQK